MKWHELSVYLIEQALQIMTEHEPKGNVDVNEPVVKYTIEALQKSDKDDPFGDDEL